MIYTVYKLIVHKYDNEICSNFFKTITKEEK
jgi:hypothetical protein